jgi:hypothetical protein
VIDPITALAGIQAAVALVKKVSKTVDDVSSLGPVLGKYFDAKSVATKAVVEAKKSKSSMSVALQIELQLDQAKRFEDELQLIFQASGRVDVWNKIKSRAAAMDVEAAHDARKEKAAKAKRDKEVDEIITIILLVVTVVVVFGATGWFVLEAIADCKGKCDFQKG